MSKQDVRAPTTPSFLISLSVSSSLSNFLGSSSASLVLIVATSPTSSIATLPLVISLRENHLWPPWMSGDSTRPVPVVLNDFDTEEVGPSQAEPIRSVRQWLGKGVKLLTVLDLNLRGHHHRGWLSRRTDSQHARRRSPQSLLMLSSPVEMARMPQSLAKASSDVYAFGFE